MAILEFATEVDGREVEGIDKLTFDEDGRIRELKVMLRPASALQAVGARIAGSSSAWARVTCLRTAAWRVRKGRVRPADARYCSPARR